jgi:hypothetical protein
MQTESSKPRVSIISPVYNAEKFIGRCIESVRAQTFQDWEQIIVDDGSSDDTEAVVRQVDDPRIRYIRLPHRGLRALGESYNTALNAARGELVAVLEGDDEWLPHKLERQVAAFTDPQVTLCWGGCLVINDHNAVMRRWALPRLARRNMSLPELFRILVRWNIVSPALTVMVRRGALDAIGGFSQVGSSMFVDLPTWLKISATASGRAVFINEDVGLYRIYSSNTGTLQNSKMREEHQDVADAIVREIGAQRMAELGWTPEDERKTVASSSLTRGIAYFQQKDRARARSAFASALRHTRSPREYAVAGVGLASSVTGLDFIGAAQRLRNRMGAWNVRLTPHVEVRDVKS